MRVQRFRLLLLVVSTGCARPGVEAAAPPAHPAAPPQTLRICVVDEGRLTEVEAQLHPQRADTLVGGRPFSQRFPVDERYAANAPWYPSNEPFTFMGACYLKYGMPRVIPASALRRVGEYRGVGLYAEVDDVGERPSVIYVPLRPGCRFQTYQYELLVRPCESRGRPGV